jgi:hypothetical protein
MFNIIVKEPSYFFWFVRCTDESFPSVKFINNHNITKAIEKDPEIKNVFKEYIIHNPFVFCCKYCFKYVLESEHPCTPQKESYPHQITIFKNPEPFNPFFKCSILTIIVIILKKQIDFVSVFSQINSFSNSLQKNIMNIN